MADYNRKPLMQRMNENFLATDLYAEPIRFYFKGAQTFPSLAGALISWAVRISIFIFAATRMLGLVANQSQSIYTTAGIMDFTYQNKINFLNYSNYDFMVGFSNSYTPAQGNVTMYIETYQAGKLLNRTALNTGECDTNTPGQVFTDADFNATLGDDYTMYCPNHTETTLNGNNMQNLYTVLNVEFSRCSPTKFITCTTDSEFYKFQQSSWLTLFVQQN